MDTLKLPEEEEEEEEAAIINQSRDKDKPQSDPLKSEQTDGGL